jgi:hypothetical protein
MNRYSFQIGDPSVGPLPTLTARDAASALRALYPHMTGRTIDLTLKASIGQRPHAIRLLATSIRPVYVADVRAMGAA